MPQNEAFVLRRCIFAARMRGFFGDIVRCAVRRNFFVNGRISAFRIYEKICLAFSFRIDYNHDRCASDGGAPKRFSEYGGITK